MEKAILKAIISHLIMFTDDIVQTGDSWGRGIPTGKFTAGTGGQRAEDRLEGGIWGQVRSDNQEDREVQKPGFSSPE